jgi:hypothetical protein
MPLRTPPSVRRTAAAAISAIVAVPAGSADHRADGGARAAWHTDAVHSVRDLGGVAQFAILLSDRDALDGSPTGNAVAISREGPAATAAPGVYALARSDGRGTGADGRFRLAASLVVDGATYLCGAKAGEVRITSTEGGRVRGSYTARAPRCVAATGATLRNLRVSGTFDAAPDPRPARP